MARDLQDGLDDMVREAELDDIKSQANKIISQWWTLDTQRDLSSLVSSLVIQK